MQHKNLKNSGKFAIAVLLAGSAVVNAQPNPAKAGSANAESSVPASRANYVIGPADVLQISVLKEPDASVAAAVVRSDGVISVPLLKEIHAGGLTPKQLEARITEGLSKYIREADVTVIVKEIHSERFFVIGAVRREGPVPLTGPCTVLQALSEAGGFTDYAKRNKIYVLRAVGGKQTRLPFNYASVLRGEHPEQNIELQPGDTVVVP